MARRSNGGAQRIRRKNSTRSKAGRSKKTNLRRAQTRAYTALSRAQNVMSHAVSGDLNDIQKEVGQIVSDLENRLNRLNALSKRGAGHAAEGVNDLVLNAISNVTGRFRDSARAVSNDAARYGDQALRRVATEIDRRPLLTLAIAAGIGFLAGMARHADQRS